MQTDVALLNGGTLRSDRIHSAGGFKLKVCIITFRHVNLPICHYQPLMWDKDTIDCSLPSQKIHAR